MPALDDDDAAQRKYVSQRLFGIEGDECLEDLDTLATHHVSSAACDECLRRHVEDLKGFEQIPSH